MAGHASATRSADDKGYSGRRDEDRPCRKIAADFAAIPVRRAPKVKVGVVGEIYVKYSPLGNNDLEKFLASQDCEVNLPGLMGFVQYCVYNMAETVRLYGGISGGKTRCGVRLLSHHRAAWRSVMIDALKEQRLPRPACPSSELMKLAGQATSSARADKMGEGWLLTAEMVELVRVRL